LFLFVIISLVVSCFLSFNGFFYLPLLLLIHVFSLR
jgi:hypothetical protein